MLTVGGEANTVRTAMKNSIPKTFRLRWHLFVHVAGSEPKKKILRQKRTTLDFDNCQLTDKSKKRHDFDSESTTSRTLGQS